MSNVNHVQAKALRHHVVAPLLSPPLPGNACLPSDTCGPELWGQAASSSPGLCKREVNLCYYKPLRLHLPCQSTTDDPNESKKWIRNEGPLLPARSCDRSWAGVSTLTGPGASDFTGKCPPTERQTCASWMSTQQKTGLHVSMV